MECFSCCSSAKRCDVERFCHDDVGLLLLPPLLLSVVVDRQDCIARNNAFPSSFSGSGYSNNLEQHMTAVSYSPRFPYDFYGTMLKTAMPLL